LIRKDINEFVNNAPQHDDIALIVVKILY